VYHEAMRNTITYAKAIHTSTLLAMLKIESLKSSRMLLVCMPIGTQAFIKIKKDYSPASYLPEFLGVEIRAYI
jgi:hypothetical protein